MDHVLVMVSHVMLNVRFPVSSIADADVGPNVLCVVLCCAVLCCAVEKLLADQACVQLTALLTVTVVVESKKLLSTFCLRKRTGSFGFIFYCTTA